MLRHLSFLLVIVLFVSNSSAQSPIYENNISKDVGTIKWMEQSADGTILIGGEDGLAGYDPKSGKLKWKGDHISEPNADWYVSFEPYALFTIKAFGEDGNAEYSLVNGSTGEKLYASKNRILLSHLNVEKEYLLMEVETKPGHSLIKYDISKNEIAWTCSFEKGGYIESHNHGYSLFNTPIQFNDDYIVCSRYKDAYGIDIYSGEILWKNSYKYKVQFIYLLPNKNKALIQSDKYLDYIEVTNGEVLNEELRAKAPLEHVFEWDENQLLLFHNRGFNILDYKQNKLLIGKTRIYFEPEDVLKVGDHYLIYGGEVINLHDAEGEIIWSKSTVGKIKEVQLRKEGIFVLTQNKALVLDYEKGRAIDKAGIGFSRTSAVYYDDENESVVSFDGRTLQTFDIKTREKKVLNKKIKLKKYSSERNFLRIEKREKGYFVYSDQHTAFFDFNGNEVFNNFYYIIRRTIGFGESLLESEFGGGVARDFLDDGKRTSANKRRQNHGVILGLGINSERLSAAYEVGDYLYLLVYIDRHPYLAKINKDSGEMEKKFILKDDDPTYILDEFDNLLILAEGEDTLTGIQLD